jgi:hypothetical protein
MTENDWLMPTSSIIQPPTTSRDGADQAGPSLELLRTDVASRCIVREQDLARRRLLYGEGYTIRGVQRILKEHGIASVQRLADCAKYGYDSDEAADAEAAFEANERSSR